MSSKLILLVEDDANDVLFFQRAMTKVPMTNPLHVATDGQQAIDYLKSAGRFVEGHEVPFPDLILLDLKLPFVMGLDVLKWIRQEFGLSPIVVILSSSRDDADIAAAYRLGANAYLVKPAEVSMLGDMARAINDFFLTQNTPPPVSRMNRELQIVANPRTHEVASYRCESAVTSHTTAHCNRKQTDL
jgi:CheY-like chemotaxis protein